MDYKVASLKEKIYKNFVTGVYGDPVIPTADQVTRKLEEITTTDFVPIMSRDRLVDIDVSVIEKKFSDAIDDLDVMYSAVEKESSDILDQLTSSLKEHNGIKRELKKIKSTTEDIQSGKLGEEYLQYQFTESFDDTQNINLSRSHPINLDGGLFEIQRNLGKLVNLNHYYGHKLEWNIVEAFAKIKENNYVGSVDASAILDQQDPAFLTYRIVTDRSTRLRTSFVLQLTPDEKEVEINSIKINIDSSITKGYVRIYYRKSYKWNDVPTQSIQEIKGDLVSFDFLNVFATHIRVEFIKDAPDNTLTNEYLFSINNIAILKADTKRVATLYSKPIEVSSFANESVIVSRLKAMIDADIPQECNVKVYVAQDIKLSGLFLNDVGEEVDPKSTLASTFDPYASGTTYLSDILEAPKENISGIDPYFGLDFEWKQLKVRDQIGDTLPDVVEFANIKSKEQILNSLYTQTSLYLFGDANYTEGYPQTGVSPVWFASGWCNITNPNWTYLQPYVISGILVSGVDVAALYGVAYDNIEIDNGASGQILNPTIANASEYSGQWLGYGSGYPLDFYIESKNRTWRYGEYDSAIDGWWRPYSSEVTPTGISPEYKNISGYLSEEFRSTEPDFFFNNVNFYKVYKFSNLSKVIDSTIRLYTYQTKPLEGDGSTVTYPHFWTWKYQDSWKTSVNSKLNVTQRVSGSGHIIDVSLDQTNEEILVAGIQELRLHNSNVVFSELNDYIPKYDSEGVLKYIDLSPMQGTYPYINISGEAFDYIYNYRTKNEYTSTWTTFAIVSPIVSEPRMIVKNPKSVGSSKKIIQSITITDLDDNTIYYSSTDVLESYNITLKNYTATNKHFKIIMHCLSDSSTGFCAKVYGTNETYLPFTNSNIEVNQGIMFVSNLTPIQLVDFATLIYNTHLNNDTRAGIYTDFYDERYIVIKEPSKRIFPGYGFNVLGGYYDIYETAKNQNTNHYIRYGKDLSGDGQILYTTGSLETTVYDNSNVKDTGWNKGQTLPAYKNTYQDIRFPNHSSYAYPINIDKYANDIGFLFYNTAENLPGFYSISYKLAVDANEITSRFLYKIELESNKQGNLTPIVRSVRFIINN